MSIVKLAYKGDYDGVQALLNENPDMIREVDEFGHSALFGAVISKRLDICRFLVEHGADVNEQSAEFRFTVLHKACLGGCFDICQFLVENGADVTVKDQKDSDALYNAITGAGDLLMCQYLIEKGADAEGALHLASFNGKCDIVEWLLNEHALAHLQNTEQTNKIQGLVGVNAKGYRDNTPLHLACQQGHLEVCRLLIKRGADVKAVNEAGCTPLHEAVLAENASLITVLLIKHGADINAKDREDRSALHKASSMGHIDHCKALIDIGADLNILDQSKCQLEVSTNKSPLKGSIGIGDSALHCAILSGNIEMCEYLLDRGIDMSIKSATGKPIVHFACHHKKYRICSLLIQRGADVNALDYKQVQIPTHVPQKTSFSPTKSLRKHHNTNHVLSITYTETALQTAAQTGNTEACKVLLENHADVHCTDEISGNTALHLACFAGFLDICELLLDHGANINQTNRYFESKSELNREDTPLHIAAAQGHLDICFLLLNRKANFTILNRFHETCIHVVEHSIKRQLIRYCTIINLELATTIGLRKSSWVARYGHVRVGFTSTLPIFCGPERLWKQRKVRFSFRKTMLSQTIWDTEIIGICSAPGQGACVTTIFGSGNIPVVIPLRNILPMEVTIVLKNGAEDLRIVFQEEKVHFPFLKLGFGKDKQRRSVWLDMFKKHIENGR